MDSGDILILVTVGVIAFIVGWFSCDIVEWFKQLKKGNLS